MMTVLEAQVARDRMADLERAFGETATALPPGLVESFLVHDDADPTQVRIVTLWESREALAALRTAPEKPEGVRMLEAVGATPSLTVMDVVLQVEAE